MGIEDLNRAITRRENWQVSHNFTITTTMAEKEVIDRILNIKAFIGQIKQKGKLMICRTILPNE